MLLRRCDPAETYTWRGTLCTLLSVQFCNIEPRCSSSLSGGVRANREHHTQWLLSQVPQHPSQARNMNPPPLIFVQLSECAAAFDQIATPPPPLGDSSRASRLVTYMLRMLQPPPRCLCNTLRQERLGCAIQVLEWSWGRCG